MALIRRRLSGEPSRWREFEHSMEAFTSGTLDPRTAAARIERLFAGDEQILRSLRALFRGDEPESDAEDGGAEMPRFRARFAAAAAHALENQFIAEPPIAKGPNEEYDAFFYVKRTAPPAAAAAVSEIAPIAPPVMASESAADATATANASSNPSWRSSLPVVERLARQSRATLSNAFRRKSSELIEENWIELQSQLDAQRGHWSALRRNFSARARAPTLRHSSVPAAASSAVSVASGVPRIPSMLVPAVPQPHRGDVATYTCRVYDEHVTKRAVESLASPEFTSYRWHAVGGGKTKKKGSKARHVASMSTVVLTSAFVAPLPKSVGYVSVTQNFRAEDEPVLRYVPYFGDDDTASIDVSYYEAVPGELEREITDEVDEQVLMSITNKFGVSDVVYLALSNTLGFAPVVLQKRRKEIEEMERRFESFAQHPDVVERLRSDSAVTQAHRPPSGVLFTALTRYGDVSGNLPHTKELGLRCAPLTLMLESYRELFCRRCFRYDCHEHGVSQPLPRKRARPDAIPPAPCCGWTLAPASRFALRAREEAGAHNEDDVEEEDGSGAKARSRSGKKPCGTRCWMSATAPAARGSRSSKRQKRAKEKASGNAVQVECSPEWGLIETELLAKCAAIFGRTRCCVIARALQSKTCAQVHALLESQARESAASASASARDSSVPLPASPAVPRGRHSSRLARAENMKHNSALYEPCDHDGPCTAENKCGCVLRKGFCEKFCACAKGKRCHNRFTGCRCAGGKVRRRLSLFSLSAVSASSFLFELKSCVHCTLTDTPRSPPPLSLSCRARAPREAARVLLRTVSAIQTSAFHVVLRSDQRTAPSTWRAAASLASATTSTFARSSAYHSSLGARESPAGAPSRRRESRKIHSSRSTSATLFPRMKRTDVEKSTIS